MATYTIGRSDDNSIVLNDTTVSRQHAELETRKGGAYTLRDLDSTYGTRIFRDGEWLNIIEVEVTDATEVTFGEYRTTIGELVALAATPAAKAAPAPAAAAPAAAIPDDAPAEPAPAEPAQAAPSAPAPAAAPAPAPAPSSSGTGMDKRTTLFVLIGGGVLVLILIVAVVFALLNKDPGTTGNRAALAPPSTATRATFEAALVKSCSRRYAESQCRCIARHMSKALTREEFAIFVALRDIKDDKAKAKLIMERYGVTKIAAIGAKMATVVGRIQQQCGITLKR